MRYIIINQINSYVQSANEIIQYRVVSRVHLSMTKLHLNTKYFVTKLLCTPAKEHFIFGLVEECRELDYIDNKNGTVSEGHTKTGCEISRSALINRFCSTYYTDIRSWLR